MLPESVQRHRVRMKDKKNCNPNRNLGTEETAHNATPIDENRCKQTKIIKLVMSRMAARRRGANQAHHQTS